MYEHVTSIKSPKLFQIIDIAGRLYTLQNVQPLANGAQEWMIARQFSGTMYVVEVAADGSFGAVRFLY